MDEMLTALAAGSAASLVVVVLGIALWVAAVIAFFSMAINVSKMRKELKDVFAILRVQTDIIHEESRAASPGSSTGK